MDLKSQRRMAADILKCGENRIRIEESKDVEEALTRNDVRKLIVKGLITKAPAVGTGRARANETMRQKKRGRRAGRGSRQGMRGVRDGKKRNWMKRTRALRRSLRELRDTGKITVTDYREMYLLAKGNAFRNKRHLMSYIKEHEMMGAKAAVPKTAKKAATKKAKEAKK